MPSGGGRSRSGPPPDPRALRRDRPSDLAGWTVLPTSGRPGEPPPWPLERQTDREAELWTRFWSHPQAVIWERDQVVGYVGLFVRQFAEAERPASSAENRKTVRMMAADLYLTSDSLLRGRIRIEDTPSNADRPRFRSAPTTRHLTIVPSKETE
jgi:hypothetical protein